MQLMKLGSSKGVAGEYRLETMADVMAVVPWFRQHVHCDGTITCYLAVTAILPGGEEVALEEARHLSYGSNNFADTETDADTIGVQIASLPVYPVALIFSRREADCNGGEDEWEEYLTLTPPDWGKIRRRVEDALRKTTNNDVLFDIGQKLNVKLT